MKKLIFYLFITLAFLSFEFTSNAQVIFKETFDNVPGTTAGGAGTYSFPNGWFLRNVDNRTPNVQVGYVNDAWERREDFANNVGDSVAFSTSWYSPAGNSDDWMWTPMISLPFNCVLKWEAQAYDAAYRDGYEVRIMTTPGGPTGGTGTIGNQITNSTVLFSIAAEQSGSRAFRQVSLADYAGQDVYIGFRNFSSDKFILIIDNIIVEKSIDYDISVESFTRPTEYSQVPVGQNPVFDFKARISNEGKLAVSDVTLTAKVFDNANTEVFSSVSSALPSLAPGGIANFSTSESYMPVTVGTYRVEYIAGFNGTDDAMANNLKTSYFTISDSVYARDTGAVIGRLGIGAGQLGYLGQQYVITEASKLSSVTIYVDTAAVDSKMGMAVFKLTNGKPGTLLYRAPDITFTGSTAGYYNFPVVPGLGLNLAAGDTIVVAAVEIDRTLAVGTTDKIFTPGTQWVYWAGIGGGEWRNVEAFGSGFLKPFKIQANFGLICSAGPDVAKPDNIEVCNNSISPVITFSGSVPGTVFNWVNSDPSIGLAASGTGDINSFTGFNPTDSPVVATITVRPAEGACTGTAESFTITVNPTPVATTSLASQLICSGASISPISLSSNIAGTTFSWTRDNTSSATGIAAAGTGDISGVLTNTTSSSVLVSFTIVPTFNGCAGTPITATVGVISPLVAVPGDQTNVSCNGGSNGMATVMVTGGIGGYTFEWTGTSVATPTAFGLSAGPYTVTIRDINSCSTTHTFTITEPQPVVISSVTVPANATYTNGDNLNFIINYNQPVIVTGTPSLPLTLNTGGTVQAVYTSGSGSNALVFSYAISPTDQDADGINVGSSISLNGGSIANGSSCDAAVAVNNLPSTAGIRVHNAVGQSINFDAITDRTYGDADFDLGATATSGLPIEYTSSNTAVATIVGGKVHVVGAGNTTITASQAGDVNYLPATSATQALTINAKPVTVTADAKSKTYGEADPYLTYSVSPDLVSGDVFSGELQRSAGEDAGEYTINQHTLLLSDNYIVTYAGADLTIGKKPVTITSADKTKIYGDRDPELTYEVSPALVSGDGIVGELGRTAGEEVGEYTINQNTLALNKNYDVTYIGARLNIVRKAIKVTADAKTKTYGNADPAFTYVVTPELINGDTFSGALSRTPGEDAGTYPITSGTLNNNNYEINFESAALTITKASQVISWSQALVAGCNNSTSIVLTATASSGLPVAFQSSNTAVATISGNQLSVVAPGASVITASQAGNNNYLPATGVLQEFLSKLPADLLVKRWDDVLVFDNNSRQYTAYQWYKNGVIINGASGQYYQELNKLNGDYHAVVTTVNGTTLQTCPLTVTPGVVFVPLSVTPNPVDPGQTVVARSGYTDVQLQGASIVVSNVMGVVVQTIPNIRQQTNINMPHASGIYVVRLHLANGATASVNVLVKPQ